MKTLQITWTSVVVTILAVAGVALLGSYFTGMNRDWYDTLNYPSWKPPNWVIPAAWNIIFILTIISIILVWNTHPRNQVTYLAVAAYIINGILNILWSVLFFGNRLILPAAYEAGLLFLSVVMIMILVWQISKAASLLLIPYAGWVIFATFLTWELHKLNP